MIHLSKRLAAVADMVCGDSLADVGTDHGYIPIALVMSGRVSRALAMDVRPGPLEKAAANIHQYGLDNRIQTRLSDGLKNFSSDEAECIVMAGMGGLLMRDILHYARENGRLDGGKTLILQPQSDIDAVRRWLHGSGYRIDAEQMVMDAGKYYMMMRAVPGTESYGHEYEYIYGKLLIDCGHPVLEEYLFRKLSEKRERYRKVSAMDTAGAVVYTPVLLEEIRQTEEVLGLVQRMRGTASGYQEE